MCSNKREEKLCQDNSSGEVLFYAMIVIPLVVAMGIAIANFTKWSILRSSIQNELDRVSVLYVQYLNNPNISSNIIDLIQHKHVRDNIDGCLEFQGTNNKVVLIFNCRFQFSFSFFPDGEGNNYLGSLPLYARSVVEYRPIDIALVLSDGNNLRPSKIAPPNTTLTLEPEPVWGSPVNHDYFTFSLSPFYESDQILWRWSYDQAWTTTYPAWAYSSCFNPLLTQIKNAALKVHNFALKNPNSRMALLYSPGSPGLDDDGVTGATVVSYSAERNYKSDIDNSRKDDVNNNSILNLARWDEDDSDFANYMIGKRLCALLMNADIEETIGLSFSATDLSALLPDDLECDEPIKGYDPGMMHNPSLFFEECYTEQYYNLEDAISWRTPQDNPAATFNLINSLRGATNEIRGFANIRATQFGNSNPMNNLNLNSQKHIIVITNEISEIELITRREEIEDLMHVMAVERIFLTMVVINDNPYVGYDAGVSSTTLNLLREIRRDVEENNQGYPFKLIITDDLNSLEAEIIPNILANISEVILTEHELRDPRAIQGSQ